MAKKEKIRNPNKDNKRMTKRNFNIPIKNYKYISKNKQLKLTPNVELILYSFEVWTKINILYLLKKKKKNSVPSPTNQTSDFLFYFI